MAALLQQMQHVLGTWDAAGDGGQEPTVLSCNTNSEGSEGGHKTLFVASVDKFNNVDNGTPNTISIAATAERIPALGRGEFVSDEVKAERGSSVSHPIFRERRMLTKLELARAALALFTSNAGIYRPVLRKTLSFVFEFIDEILNDNMEHFHSRTGCEAPGINTSWESRANDEVGMAYERMRVMEDRMAKLVEEAALQRDHLHAEIVEREEREKRLNELLKHQMQLTHLSLEGRADGSAEDQLFVKRLIARAEKEHSIDEFMKQIESLLAEREGLNRRLQTLLDLNGRYAVQAMELAARLSILTDHNISLSVEVQMMRNEVNEVKRRSEKYLHELAIARNTIIAAFLDRQHTGNNWWSWIHKQRLEKALDDSSGLRAAATRATMFQQLQERIQQENQQPPSLQPAPQQEQPGQQEQRKQPGKDTVQEKSTEVQDSKALMADVWRQQNSDRDDRVCRLWITPYGKSTDTPAHLRATSSVEFLRVSPVVAEHFLRALLSAWYEDIRKSFLRNKPPPPLDVFTQKYLCRVCVGSKQTGNDDKANGDSAKDRVELKSQIQEAAHDYSPSPPLRSRKSKKALVQEAEEKEEEKQLSTTPTGEQSPGLCIAYALDAVARSNNCGSLTYAFGLVGWKRVSEDLFLMLEFDCAVLFALCRFLDTERCAPAPASGVLPTVYFMSILLTMYPSYSLERLSQLLNAACHDGASMAESCMLLRYDVLFPQRMLLCSASATVEGSGALWDTGFAHLLYSHICDDVIESWQSVDDSLDLLVKGVGPVASEQQLSVKGLKALSLEDHAAWSPAIRAALASWDRLRIDMDKGMIVLEEAPRVPVQEARRYLRERLVIRRGTRPLRDLAQHHSIIESLEKNWGEFSGNVPRLDPMRCAALVERVDPLRQLTWGPAEMCADETAGFIRHVDLRDTRRSPDALFRLLKKEMTVPEQ